MFILGVPDTISKSNRKVRKCKYQKFQAFQLLLYYTKSHRKSIKVIGVALKIALKKPTI